MSRALFGLLKGLLIGCGVGYLLLHFNLGAGLLAYLGCGLMGATVGLVCGRAPWRAETIWTPVLKMLFGIGVSVGLFALGRKFLLIETDLKSFLPFLTHSIPLNSAPVLVSAIGGLYGSFVELDDGGSEPARLSGRESPKLSGKSPTKSLGSPEDSP